MAVKKRRTFKAKRLPVAVEHTEFYPYLLKYNEAMMLRGYSKSTLHRRESDNRRFIGWCDERSLNHPNQITKPILERYQRHLYYYRQARNNRPLSPTTQNHYLTSVRQFFKYLTQQNYLLYNPASELVIIKESVSLPVVLSVEEVERLIHQPDTNTEHGIRDRAILELFYSTGLRRSELCNLTLHDVSLTRNTVLVRKGKGNKDRLIPVGKRALKWIAHYLDKVRDQFLTDIQNDALFLNDYGDAFRDNKLGDKVKRFMVNAGIDVAGSCHLLRHAMATHMLENGAELRYIQAMLGHASVATTQIYTHVSIRQLQNVHDATHPATAEEER
jgi:integrase/recombinase XerD